MSKITAIFNVPGMTAAQYDNVIRELDRAGAGKPKERLHHVASPQPDGWLVVDVWESGEALERFAGTLMPILAKNGVTPPQPAVYPVHNIIR